MNASSSSANSGCAARPSIVVTSRPSAYTASVQQALTGSPSAHRAGAAYLDVARALRAREIEALAQEVEQQLLGRHVADDRCAVDAQLEVHARIPAPAPTRPAFRVQAAQYSATNSSRYLSATMRSAASAGIGCSGPCTAAID